MEFLGRRWIVAIFAILSIVLGIMRLSSNRFMDSLPLFIASECICLLFVAGIFVRHRASKR